MTVLALALLASLSWGAADFLGGLTARRVALPLLLLVSQAVGLLALAGPLLLRGRPPALGGHLVAALGAGAASALALGLLYLAMSRGSMVVAAPVAATGAVLPVLVGAVRGDPLPTVALVGGALALGGAVVTSVEPGRWTARGVPAAVGSAMALGLFFVLLDAASRPDPWWATAVVRATSCALVLLLVLARRRSTGAGRPLRRADRWGMAAVGVCDATAEVSFAVATTAGHLAVVSVLSSLYPVVTVLLAVVLLRERLRPVQAVGAAGALAGVLLLARAT
jgi:drug/metabolite transporter (DMT)-like permease